jgi:uncharacterized membrane protein
MSFTGIATRQAFRWTELDGMTGLGFLDPNRPSSTATGVSADGSVVVGHSQSGLTGAGVPRIEAFRWTASDGMLGLGFPDPNRSYSAVAVSADGSVVIGDSGDPNVREAFRWTAIGGISPLGFLDPSTPYSEARALSADGSIIVGVSDTPEGFEAFRWTAIDGMQNLRDVLVGVGLDLTGWDLLGARGISADGLTIVGIARNPDGILESWAAVIPEPSSTLLALLGVAGVMLLRDR